jgi:hypothetical protein
MKKSTLFASATLSLGSFFLSAQTSNHPFPAENAYWHTTLDCDQYSMDLFSCRDTVFSGIKYQQLYMTLSKPGFEKTLFTGGYRIEGEQVFFRHPYPLQEERLIYDFSMQEGDSARLYRCLFDTSTSSLTVCGAPYFLVEKIDSVLLPDGWRKRWQVRTTAFSFEEEIWIEGIGATFSPLHRFKCLAADKIATMGCFWHQGEVEFVEDSATQCNISFPPDCFVTVGTSQQKLKAFVVSVSPNPFDNYLSISFSDEIPSSTSVRLFDMTGREIVLRQQKMGDSFQIERGKLPPGVYFLKIENSAKAGFSQVVKVVAN